MPIALALAISAVLHAAAIVMPGWTLPGDAEPESPPLEARLALPPAATASEAPKPKRVRAPRHATPAAAAKSAPNESVAELASAESQPQAAVDPAPAPAPEVPPAPQATPVPPAPPSPPWPRQGRLRYVVKYGDGGFVVGETVQEWRFEGDRYSIRSEAVPKGLAALRGTTRTQTSEGEVTAAGLRPREFRDQREGRNPEVASFDWAAGQVTFSNGRAPTRTSDGMQDMTSVFYQLAWLAPRQNIEVAVATASRVGHWTFEWLGEEKLETASNGSLDTLHLRTRSDGDTTEVWLAPAYGGLPVKIRYVDRKGDAFEQIADSPEQKN